MKKKILITIGVLGLLMSTMFVFLNTGGTVSVHGNIAQCVFPEGGACDCYESNGAGYCDCGPWDNTPPNDGDGCSQYGIGPNGEDVVTGGVIEYFHRPVSKIRSEK